MNTTIIYDIYNKNGTLLGRTNYCPKDTADYDRVMNLIKEKPDQYKLVNCEYGFEFAK